MPSCDLLAGNDDNKSGSHDTVPVSSSHRSSACRHTVTVLVGVLVNNSVMNAQIRRLDEKIDSKAEVLSAHLHRVGNMFLGKFAELDMRLTRIEAHLKLR
ncbi:MAG: hypothetical protein ACR2JB_16770 [Bryobacteraceae bacterium]